MTILTRCLVPLLVCVGLCLGSGAALADVPGEPPVDWSVRSTFIGADGEDIPLRIGVVDTPIRQGFGVRHIIEGHDQLPDEQDIDVVLGRSDSLCKYTSADQRYRCAVQIGDRAIIVVYTQRIDTRAPDGRPVGIVTAYYTPRGCPC